MSILIRLEHIEEDLAAIRSFTMDIDLILDRMIARDDVAYDDRHAIKDIISNIRRVLA